LAALYDQFIGPVRAHLGSDATRLTVIADGEISGIPFDALRDARGGHYLVESFTVRFAGSLREATWPQGGAPAAGSEQVLLVANPAFSPREFPLLQPLAGAEEEVAAISRLYPQREVVPGPAATRERLRRSFTGAGIIHFAGHAVFDDERPEQSYLVLAFTGVPGSSRLTAAEVGGMDLRGVRLVVLSACETLRSHGGRSGGFTGLAGALLGAGAGGVIGSLWRVDDDQTRALMTEFHGAYRASGDASAALRVAQITLLRGLDARLRSPAAWAGFRYTGR
jgi:CHAT domain-containing protein